MTVKEARQQGYYVENHKELSRLHSAYNPLSEAEKLVPDNWPDHNKYVVVGAGLGYLLQLIAENNEAPEVAVFEPHPELLREGRKRKIWSRDDFRELEIFGPDGEPTLTRLGEFIPLEEHSRFTPIEWPDYRRKNPGFFKPLLQDLKRLQDYHEVSLRTLETKGQTWLENFEQNISTLPRVKIPRFDDFRGNIALVAAGPSLDKQLDWLRSNREKLFVIVVNTAGPILKKRNIQADLHVAVDAKPEIYEDLVHSSVSNLLISPFVPPEVTTEFEQPLCLLGLESPLTHWLASAEFLPTANAGGSVTTTSLNMLTGCPAENIYLLGGDMEFNGQRYYARGTWREEKLLRRVNRFQPYVQVVLEWQQEAKNLNEAENPRLKDEREWFNKLSSEDTQLSIPPPTPSWWEGREAPTAVPDPANESFTFSSLPDAQFKKWIRKQLEGLHNSKFEAQPESDWEKFRFWVKKIVDDPEPVLANWEQKLEILIEK